MNCVRPPLLKQPSRGFAWACGPCSRAQEIKAHIGRNLEDEGRLSELGRAVRTSPNQAKSILDIKTNVPSSTYISPHMYMRYTISQDRTSRPYHRCQPSLGSNFDQGRALSPLHSFERPHKTSSQAIASDSLRQLQRTG